MKVGGRWTPDIAQSHFTECKDNEQEGKNVLQNHILECVDGGKKVNNVIKRHDAVGGDIFLLADGVCEVILEFGMMLNG